MPFELVSKRRIDSSDALLALSAVKPKLNWMKGFMRY